MIKKNLKLIILSMCLILLCGCSKTTECKYSYNSDVVNMEYSYSIKHSNNKVNSVSIKEVYTLLDSSSVDGFKFQLDSKFRDYDTNSISYSSSYNDNVISVNYSFKPSKLSDEDKNNLDLSLYDKDYSDVISNLTYNGFTCE